MKFTEEHKKILREFGHSESDMWQLEEVVLDSEDYIDTEFTIAKED